MKDEQIKNVLYLSFAAILRNLLGVIRAKLISIWFGISGLGILGQIISFYSFQSQILDFGVYNLLSNRIGKYSEKENEEEVVQVYFFSIFTLLLTNFIFFVAIILFRHKLTLLLFDSEEYLYLTILIAFLTPFHTSSQFPEAVLRAKQNFKKLAIGQNLTQLIAILTLVPSLFIWGINGIIYNMYIYLIFNSVFFYLNVFKIVPSFSKLSFTVFYKNINAILKFCITDSSRKFLIFSSFLIFRIFIVQFSSIDQNGYFQSIWSISNYLNIIFAAFGTYLFPVLSSFKDHKSFNMAMNNIFEQMFYLVMPIAAIILLFPEFFLYILYNKDFTVMQYPLKIFIALRIWDTVYFVVIAAFMARVYLRAFLFSELVKSITLVSVSYFAIQHYQLTGAIISIIIMHIFAFILLLYYMKKHPVFRLSKKNFDLLFKVSFAICIMLVPMAQNIFLRIAFSIIFIIIISWSLNFNTYNRILKTFYSKKINRV